MRGEGVKESYEVMNVCIPRFRVVLVWMKWGLE